MVILFYTMIVTSPAELVHRYMDLTDRVYSIPLVFRTPWSLVRNLKASLAFPMHLFLFHRLLLLLLLNRYIHPVHHQCAPIYSYQYTATSTSRTSHSARVPPLIRQRLNLHPLPFHIRIRSETGPIHDALGVVVPLASEEMGSDWFETEATGERSHVEAVAGNDSGVWGFVGFGGL